MSQHVPASADSRVVNNTVRHQYRVLTDAEKADMVQIKDLGAAFLSALHRIGGTSPDADRLASRELSLAQTRIEEAVMWAVKHVTR